MSNQIRETQHIMLTIIDSGVNTIIALINKAQTPEETGWDTLHQSQDIVPEMSLILISSLTISLISWHKPDNRLAPSQHPPSPDQEQIEIHPLQDLKSDQWEKSNTSLNPRWPVEQSYLEKYKPHNLPSSFKNIKKNQVNSTHQMIIVKKRSTGTRVWKACGEWLITHS